MNTRLKGLALIFLTILVTGCCTQKPEILAEIPFNDTYFECNGSDRCFLQITVPYEVGDSVCLEAPESLVVIKTSGRLSKTESNRDVLMGWYFYVQGDNWCIDIEDPEEFLYISPIGIWGTNEFVFGDNPEATVPIWIEHPEEK